MRGREENTGKREEREITQKIENHRQRKTGERRRGGVVGCWREREREKERGGKSGVDGCVCVCRPVGTVRSGDDWYSPAT